jgi:hypothetical protein
MGGVRGPMSSGCSELAAAEFRLFQIHLMITWQGAAGCFALHAAAASPLSTLSRIQLFCEGARQEKS